MLETSVMVAALRDGARRAGTPRRHVAGCALCERAAALRAAT
jgi:hypothetical protein